MTDIQNRILSVLVTSRKPLRAFHISKKLKTSQSHIEYHLRQMVADGVVIQFDDDDGRFYDAQPLLKKQEVMNDFLTVLAGAMPNLLPYLDLTHSESEVDAVINNIIMLMKCAEKRLEKELGACKDLVNNS
jgi:DNA-binding transcriptional regulator GbsR (MarR family)